ncbi:MAG: sel1 repeat family protein, partial [Pyrinomonadaceae bacterium]|nr:sel1 repeat family protein [Pyrinomonadaceae bacterium]
LPPPVIAPTVEPPRPAPSASDSYSRGVQLWSQNRTAAVAEFRQAATSGNPDAYYYLGLSIAEGRDPQTLNRSELLSALEYFQRARGGRFGASARRYEEQLGNEVDRRRGGR